MLLPWRKVRSPGKHPVEKASFVHVEDAIYLVFFALLADGHASCDGLVIGAPRFAMEKQAAQIVSGDKVLCPVLARVKPSYNSRSSSDFALRRRWSRSFRPSVWRVARLTGSFAARNSSSSSRARLFNCLVQHAWG